MPRRTRSGIALRTVATAFLLVGVTAIGGAAPATATITGDDEPGEEYPLFDFTDKFYTQNGIKVSALINRRSGEDGLSVKDRSPDRIHRDVRVLLTFPGYDHDGDFPGPQSGGGDGVFWTIMADLAADPFTDNEAGEEAEEIAEEFPLYVFPRLDGDPLGFGNSKQAEILEDRHGYFSNNPLGLWIYKFVNWTDAAFDTPEGRARLAELERRNGIGGDGTPIVKSIDEVEDLEEDGFVTVQERPRGTEARYFVCPMFKDPRDGGIAKDAILATVFDDRGKVPKAEKHFVKDFKSLQKTGDWSD